MFKNFTFLALFAAALFAAGAPDAHAGARPKALRRADTLSAKAKSLYEKGKYSEAAKPANEALSIREKVLGKNHPDTAAALNNLAGILEAQGDCAGARPLYERALSIFETAFGPEDPRVAATLNNLGGVLRNLGFGAAARRSYERALKIDRAAAGPQSPEAATDLNNLASLLEEMGDYAAARPLYEEALRIDESAHGPESPETAVDLNNLGGLLEAQGDYQGARTLFERALKLTEKARGPDHPDVAVRLLNLGGVLRTLGDNAAARAHYERALRIDEKALGLDHPDVATDLNNLANLLATQGDHAGARGLYERSIAVLSKRLGPDHPRVAGAQNNLANLLRDQRDFAGAQRLYERALAITERRAAPWHPEMYVRLFNAGLNRWSLGEREAARAFASRGIAVLEKNLDALADVTSERERVELVRSLKGYLDAFLSLFDADGDGPEAYTAQLKWKGAVMTSLLRQREGIAASREPALGARVESLSAVRRNLAALAFGARGPRDENEAQRTAKELTARKEAIERDLYRLSADFRDEKTFLAAGIAQICARLGPSEVLVDYLLYDRYAPAGAGTRPKELIEPSYLAFVLTGGAECERPVRVELGPSGAVDRAVGKYRALVKERRPTSSADAAAAEVRRLVWDPLAARVGARNWAWVVPDGALSGVPFAALPKGREYLVERHVFGYLGSAAELSRLGSDQLPVIRDRSGPRTTDHGPRTTERVVGALVVGGIDYGTVPAGPSGAAAGARGRCDVLEEFKNLDGAEQEVRDVAGILSAAMAPASVKTVTGMAATEAELRRQMPGKRIVHLATHGFFSELQCGPASSNPMIRSGVVFAGVNARRGGGEDDGVLTAEEVVGLELRGTELVVLSACETGLGEIFAGEGVMGLRRAFALAGARSLVMSLWKVPDEGTRRLMREFYSRVASKPDTPKPAALRDAQIALLRDNREKFSDPEPHTWAGFIVSGK